MFVFGHRGFSGIYPENTMRAFEEAYKTGADGVEMDVHYSADEKLIVIHDELLKRTTGKDGCVSDYTAAELVKINAGLIKENAYGFTPIPRFEELCEYWAGVGFTVNVEIKTNNTWYPGIEEKVWDTVKHYKLEDKVIFSSFNWLSCVRMKQLAPDVPCGILYENKKMVNAGSLAGSFGFEFCHPGEDLVDDALVADCRKNNVELNVWTINRPEQMQHMMDVNVRSVISNFPDMCLNMLKKDSNK